MENNTPLIAAGGELMSYAEVEERLVAALLVCWRSPDRERGWMRLRSHWPEITREAWDYDARGGDGTSSDVALRPAAQTRAEVAEMEEAFGWLDAVAGDDRRLIGLVLSRLARGDRQVPWMALRSKMGLRFGADGLRKRYERAMGKVCVAANGGFLRASIGQAGESDVRKI